MSTLMSTSTQLIREFCAEEDGAQIVEYALIIGAVSLALIVLLATGTNNLGASFATMLGKVSTCLGGGAC